MSNAAGKVDQHLGKPLSRGVTGHGNVNRKVTVKVIGDDGQCILEQPWVLDSKPSDRGAVPNQSAAILHGFRADEVIRQP